MRVACSVPARNRSRRCGSPAKLSSNATFVGSASAELRTLSPALYPPGWPVRRRLPGGLTELVGFGSARSVAHHTVARRLSRESSRNRRAIRDATRPSSFSHLSPRASADSYISSGHLGSPSTSRRRAGGRFLRRASGTRGQRWRGPYPGLRPCLRLRSDRDCGRPSRRGREHGPPGSARRGSRGAGGTVPGISSARGEAWRSGILTQSRRRGAAVCAITPDLVPNTGAGRDGTGTCPRRQHGSRLCRTQSGGSCARWRMPARGVATEVLHEGLGPADLTLRRVTAQGSDARMVLLAGIPAGSPCCARRGRPR